MSDQTLDKSFVQLAYNELALSLDGEDIDALTARAENGTALPDVKLVHKPSGTIIDVSECSTQMENMVIAGIRMLSALARQSHRTPDGSAEANKASHTNR